MAGDRPTEADDLYALEPAAFVAARNALARQLRSDGRRDDATAVSELRRPTPTAWALNMVARARPELVEQALDTGHRLREATEAAVGGKADQLRSATTADQEASGAVVEAAVKQLGARGAGLTPTVRATVRAAVLSDDLADELRRGVLSTEHEAGGFEFGAGFTAAPVPKASPSPTRGSTAKTSGSDAAARREAREAERAAQKERRAELQAKVKGLRSEASELEREAKAQERAAEQQERAARAARAAADTAARDLEDARRQLDEA